MTIEVDNLTFQLILRWKAHRLDKPDVPDDYAANVDHLRIRMDEWERQDAGYRALVGARLCKLALEES